jgi:hypothetical protein
MKMQTTQLERAFAPNEISLRHLNGPITSETAADPSLEKMVKGPYFEWWNATETSTNDGVVTYRYTCIVFIITLLL